MIAFFCMVALLFGMVASVPYYVTLLPAILCGGRYLYVHLRRKPLDMPAIAIQSATLSAFLLYWLLRNASPFFYRALHSISRAYSGVAGVWAGRTASMSVTYSGVDLVALFVFAVVALLVVYKKKSPLLYVGSIFCVLVAWGGYMALWTILAENTMAIGLNRVEPLTGPLDFRVLLFTALLAPWMCLYDWLRRPKLAKRAPKMLYDRRRTFRGIAFALAAPAICLAAWLVFRYAKPSAPVTVPGQTIVFWDSGIDFSVPEVGVYGLDKVGMFGTLPHYLASKGYVCRVAGQITATELEGASVLVVLNPMYTPDAAALEAVWNFVESGGGVLAVGDHTGDEQIRLPLNTILQPTGISYNFDSAIPFLRLWPDNFIMRRSPIFSGVAYPQIQAVIGASLDIGNKGRPLLIGRNGYSDAGDITNVEDGYLGNMRFDRGEPVGDLILAAEARHGTGKFLVFGDTTLFQNTVLAYSKQFVDNIFAYLAGGSGQSSTGRTDQSSTGRPDQLSTGRLDQSSIGGSGQSSADGPSRLSTDGANASPGLPDQQNEPEANAYPGFPGQQEQSAFPPYQAVCLIDAAHLPSFSLDKDGGAVDGFIACGLRAGLFSEFHFDGAISTAIARRGNIEFVVLMEPALYFSEQEKQQLRGFVADGGTLIMFGNYQSPPATWDIFEHFGFSFDRVPYGHVAPAQNPDMAFWNACPLFYEQSPVVPGIADVESLMDVWGECVIARQELGRGQIFAFGDSGFIKNDNLESVESYRAGNVEFVIGLLRKEVG